MLRCLEALDDDIRQSALDKIRTAWTLRSTAIEGNSLSEFDVRMLIEEGLTVGGKTLREHQQVAGHARCVDRLLEMARRPLSEADLFDLHACARNEVVLDPRSPMGAWRREPRAAYVTLADGSSRSHEFPAPELVPALMDEYVREANGLMASAEDMGRAELAFAHAKLHAGFVSVHPFPDGNGRLARLVSNLPLLSAGSPPILVGLAVRAKYLRLLAEYQEGCGAVTPASGVWPDGGDLGGLAQFFADCHSETLGWVDEAHALQRGRDAKRGVQEATG